MSAVYGANCGVTRRSLLKDLIQYVLFVKGKSWMVAGDFNCIMYSLERVGGDDHATFDEDMRICILD
jgi:hypothetical protein